MNVAGQELDSIGSGDARKSTTSLVGRIRQGLHYLDSTARVKGDPAYIEVPERPWRVVLRYKWTAFDVQYENSIENVASGEKMDWQLYFRPPVASSIGLWVGYRGMGLSFAKSLVKNEGVYFSFSTTGAKYGFNLRARRSELNQTTLSAKVYRSDGTSQEGEFDGETRAPVTLTSLYLNGYYVFNGRHYSQAAAYNQSVIQRRSAGSFLLGATWYLSELDFSDRQNASLIILSNNIGRIQQNQLNLGIGYGYNFVPTRGLVINAMVMPTISVLNGVRAYKYDMNYDAFAEMDKDDYGQWDPQTRTWANGKTNKPIADNDDEGKWLEDVDVWRVGSEKEFGNVHLNVDVRIGIAYNFGRYFIGLQGQLNTLSYKKDQCKVRFIDGYGRVALGVRL